MLEQGVSESDWKVFLARAGIILRELLPILLAITGIAMSSRSPFIFGMLGAIYWLHYADRRLRRFVPIYKLWHEARHPLLSLRVAGPHLLPFFACWLFHAAVMLGLVSPQMTGAKPFDQRPVPAGAMGREADI